MIERVAAPLTHGSTAVWVIAFPVLLTLAVLCAVTLGGRPLLHLWAQRTLARHLARGGRATAVDPALVFWPPILTTQQFLGYALGTCVTLLVILWLLMPMWLCLLLAPLATVLLMQALLWSGEQRYIRKLDTALPATVGRFAALLANGHGFQPVLHTLLIDLPDGPLKAEWTWLLQRMGTTSRTGPATPHDVVRALREQTPSQRHAALLDHLAIALGQTHDVLTRRMEAAAIALHEAERRQSAAATELAQMKYSGVAVGLAGLVMAGYLALTQWERVVIAYGNPVGLAIGSVVAAALVAPLLAGVLLARADDVDY